MSTSKFKIESGVQLLARLCKKTGVKNFYPVLFEDGLKHGDVVEIFSNISTSSLLIDIISDALLPSKPNEDPVGVLVFNTVGQINYEQMLQTIKKRINFNLDINLDQKSRKSEFDKMLNRTLSCCYFLEIYDATQFYTTIHNLDNIFMQHSNISLIIFDALTAYYWSEQGFKITKMDLYVRNLLRMVQKVSKEYKVIIIYTRPEYFSSSKDINDLEISELTEGVNYSVQLVDKVACKGVYKVNVKSVNSFNTKYFSISDNLIKWLTYE